MKNKKPIVGVILDFEEGGESKYSPFPFYALRKNYFDAISLAGGLPVAIPYDNSAIEQYLNILDGLVIAGGNFDIPPSFYGDNEIHQTVTTNEARTNFEFSLTKKFIDENKSVLGICGGMQLINVVCGGSLYQDIPSQISGAFNHEVKDRLKAAHNIEISENSMLYKIVKSTKLGVNTSHHQAVKKVADGFIASAKAEDGVVEAIENPSKKFVLGTQWHPEYLISEEEKNFYKYFINSCK